MKPNHERSRFTLDIDPIHRRRLQAHAADNGRTLASEIRLAIRDYLDNLARRKRT